MRSPRSPARALVLIVASGLTLAGCPRGEATPHPCPGQLAPVEVQVASTAREVVLTWDAHNRATAFRVERAEDEGGPFVTVGEVETATFVDATAATDARLFYKVHAVGAGCEAPAHAAHEAFGPAAAPDGLFGQAFSDAGISISWDDTGMNTSGFVVQKRAPGRDWETADERGPAARASNLGGFRSDTIYTMRVGALVPSSVEPTWSAPIEVLTFPRPVLEVAVEAIGPSSVRVSWVNNNANAVFVEVGKKLANAILFDDYAEIPVGTNSFVDDTLEEWVFYRYQFIVHNAAGASEEVVVPAAAWLPPRLFWEGAPELSDSCVLTSHGSFQIDLGHGASLADAGGEATGVGAPPLSVTADQTGVDVDLGQAWEGVVDVTWSLSDTFGQTRSATRRIALARAGTTDVLAAGLPSAVLGGDSGEGRQMLLPLDDFVRTGCDDACLGRRASLALGDAHTCVLDDAGGVLCAGRGAQLGRGSAAPPSDDRLDSVCLDDTCTDTLKEVELLAAGDAFTCALTAAGEVRCWGEGGLGQLGGPAAAASPVLVVPDAVALAAGGAHACALSAAGEVTCWGANDNGQLGLGTTSPSEAPAIVCASGSGPGCPALSGVVALAAGAAHTCAIIGDEGRLMCWGRGDEGQLGDGSSGAATVSTLPVPVGCGAIVDERCAAGALVGMSSIALGDAFSCASGGGRVACWGRGDEGQLGDGLLTSSAAPVEVVAAIDGVPLSSAVALSGGGQLACAQDASAHTRCWGTLAAAAAASAQATPLCDAGLGCGMPFTETLAASVGAGHLCAVDLAGHLRCLGDNGDGQLGAGAVGADSDAVTDACTGASCATFVRAARRACGPLSATVVSEEDASGG